MTDQMIEAELGSLARSHARRGEVVTDEERRADERVRDLEVELRRRRGHGTTRSVSVPLVEGDPTHRATSDADYVSVSREALVELLAAVRDTTPSLEDVAVGAADRVARALAAVSAALAVPFPPQATKTTWVTACESFDVEKTAETVVNMFGTLSLEEARARALKPSCGCGSNHVFKLVVTVEEDFPAPLVLPPEHEQAGRRFPEVGEEVSSCAVGETADDWRSYRVEALSGRGWPMVDLVGDGKTGLAELPPDEWRWHSRPNDHVEGCGCYVCRPPLTKETSAGGSAPLPCECWEGVDDREGRKPCEHYRLLAGAGPFDCETSPGKCRCGAGGPPWRHAEDCSHD